MNKDNDNKSVYKHSQFKQQEKPKNFALFLKQNGQKAKPVAVKQNFNVRNKGGR